MFEWRTLKMKNVQNINELEFKVIIGQAWEAEDTCFLVDYLTNRIYVGFNGSECVYQFEEKEIMKYLDMTLDGLDDYALEFRLIQKSCVEMIFGKEEGTNKILEKLNIDRNSIVPITQTPYGIFVQ